MKSNFAKAQHSLAMSIAPKLAARWQANWDNGANIRSSPIPSFAQAYATIDRPRGSSLGITSSICMSNASNKGLALRDFPACASSPTFADCARATTELPGSNFDIHCDKIRKRSPTPPVPWSFLSMLKHSSRRPPFSMNMCGTFFPPAQSSTAETQRVPLLCELCGAAAAEL